MIARDYVNIQENQPRFKLRPDIVITTEDNEKIILDTKWKLINKNKSRPKYNYDISQADMYQMFAYGKKYKKVKSLFLLYPESDNFNTPLKDFKFYNNENGDMILYVCPVKLSEDIKRERDSLKCIKEKIHCDIDK